MTLIDKTQLLQSYISGIDHYNWIRIVGPRGGGKTTLLKQLFDYRNKKGVIKSYFINFDEHIIAKQFHDDRGLIDSLSQEYGVDITKPCIVCMNEIQYSKHIEELIYRIVCSGLYQIKFITTGINGNNETEYKQVAWTSCLYPCSFKEFYLVKQLSLKDIQVNHITQHIFEHYKSYFIDFLCNGGYPAIMLARGREQKNYQTEALLRKLFDKDIGLQFSREKVILYQEYLKTIALGYESPLSVAKLLKKIGITPATLRKFEQFSQKNYLITYLQPFYTNPTRELSHKLTPIFLDNCFVSYYNARMHTTNYHLSRSNILGYLIQELLKIGYRQDQLKTYQKVNGSMIDCILCHDDGTITPYVILDHIHPVRSKALHHFIQEYHDMIDRAVEISPWYLGDHEIHGIQIVNTPSMMIGSTT